MDYLKDREWPSLVQRVIRRKTSIDKKGIDSIFEFDYMGSSEFEWGTLPKALKMMREDRKNDPKGWVIRHITIKESAIFFYGSPTMLNRAITFFQDQLLPFEERQGRTKEFTYLYETYFPRPHNRLGPYHGWWILDAKVPYLLFPNQENAKAWQEAM